MIDTLCGLCDEPLQIPLELAIEGLLEDRADCNEELTKFICINCELAIDISATL